MFYAKVYVKDKATLVLELANTRKEKTCFCSGLYMDKKGEIKYFDSSVVCGVNNILASPEGKRLFEYIVENCRQTKEDAGDLDIFQYGTNEKKVCLTWKGGNKIEIEPKDLSQIKIGCSDYPDKHLLLNGCQIKSNIYVASAPFECEINMHK